MQIVEVRSRLKQRFGDDIQLRIGLVSVAVSGVILCVYACVQFDNPDLLVKLPFAFACACLLFLIPPLLAPGNCLRVTAIGIATLGVMAVLPLLALFGPALVKGLLIIGATSLVALALTAWSVPRRPIIHAVALVIILGLIAVDFIGIERQHALLVSSAYFGGNTGDTLFHSAIGNMMLNFGVISTGVDGVASFPYHALSNLWIVALGRALGLDAPSAYSMLVPGIVMPLLLNQAVRTASVFTTARTSVSFLFALIFGAHLTYSIYDENFYFRSESLTFAISLFLGGTAAIFEIWNLQESRVIASRWVLWVLLGAALIFLTTVSKLPTGFVLLIVFSYAQWRLWGLKSALVAGVIEATCFLFAYKLAAPMFVMTTFWATQQPYFIHYYISRGNVLFLFSHFIFSWVLLSMVWLGLRDRSVKAIVQAFRECQFLPAELALLITLILMPLGFLLTGSAIYYFTNMTMWLSMPVIVGLLSDRADDIFSSMTKGAAIPLLVLVVTVSPALLEGIQKQVVGAPARMVAQKLAELEITRGDKPPAFLRALLAPVMPAPAPPTFREVAADSRRLVQRVSGLRRVYGRDLAVFISPHDKRWWDTIGRDCSSGSFLLPAYSGVPMLAGFPPARCAPDATYGWTFFRKTSPPNGESEICRYALDRGFSVVYVPQPDSWADGEVFNCRQPSG
jgi:hypothetical protein